MVGQRDYHDKGEGERDKKASIQAMYACVIDVLKKYFPMFQGKEFIQVEGIDNDVARLIDNTSCIDWLVSDDPDVHVENGFAELYDDLIEGHADGVASRVQFMQDQGTFTIRIEDSSGAPTEYQKLLELVLFGYPKVCPTWHVHAYVAKEDRSDLLAVRVVRTKDIILCYANSKIQRFYYPWVQDPDSGDWFYVAKIGQLRTDGATVYEWRKEFGYYEHKGLER